MRYGSSQEPQSLVSSRLLAKITKKKNGKWSSTTYRLALADGVRTISGHEGWEQGSFREGLTKALSDHPATDQWSEIANALGVSLAETQRFLREWRAEHLDKIEADLAALNSAP
jgi:hypothetical protein